jgi:uncharacterized protein
MESQSQLLKQIQKNRKTILDIGKQHGADSVRIFGSVVRSEETEESDIDFLVEFEPSRHLLDLIELQHELEAFLKRSVDILTEESISPYLKEKTLNEAVAL